MAKGNNLSCSGTDEVATAQDSDRDKTEDNCEAAAADNQHPWTDGVRQGRRTYKVPQPTDGLM